MSCAEFGITPRVHNCSDNMVWPCIVSTTYFTVTEI